MIESLENVHLAPDACLVTLDLLLGDNLQCDFVSDSRRLLARAADCRWGRLCRGLEAGRNGGAVGVLCGRSTCGSTLGDEKLLCRDVPRRALRYVGVSGKRESMEAWGATYHDLAKGASSKYIVHLILLLLGGR